MRADGGEAIALTEGKRSITAFAWSPDSKQIAYLAPDAKTEAEEKKEKDKDDAHVPTRKTNTRDWLLNVTTPETKAVTDAKWEVSEIAWQPTGDSVLAVATDHPDPIRKPIASTR